MLRKTSRVIPRQQGARMPAHAKSDPVVGVFASAAMLALSLVLSACSSAPSDPAATAATSAPVTTDAATRATPVVPGRKSRVFIFASLGAKCEPMAAPHLTITAPPAKGDIAFVPGQATTLQTSSTGLCAGKAATGTGVYYTAREGATGADRFTVEARGAGGDRMSRTFEVRIAD